MYNIEYTINKETNILTAKIDLNVDGGYSKAKPEIVNNLKTGRMIIKTKRIATSNGNALIGVTSDNLPIKFGCNIYADLPVPISPTTASQNLLEQAEAK